MPPLLMPFHHVTTYICLNHATKRYSRRGAFLRLRAYEYEAPPTRPMEEDKDSRYSAACGGGGVAFASAVASWRVLLRRGAASAPSRSTKRTRRFDAMTFIMFVARYNEAAMRVMPVIAKKPLLSWCYARRASATRASTAARRCCCAMRHTGICAATREYDTSRRIAMPLMSATTLTCRGRHSAIRYGERKKRRASIAAWSPRHCCTRYAHAIRRIEPPPYELRAGAARRAAHAARVRAARRYQVI